MADTETARRGILGDVIAELREALGERIDSLEIERTVLGLFFTGVKLSDGEGGLCFTPIKSIPQAVCCPSSARAMPDSGRMRGKRVMEVLDEMLLGNPLKKAIGIATINALSSAVWRERPPEGYAIRIGMDPMDEATIPDDAFVAVVGALVPYLRMLRTRGKPYAVLELDPTPLKPDEMEYFVPVSKAAQTLPRADWLIITGTTLINDTLEDLLNHARPDAEIIVVGPTASMLPDAFFRRGIGAIGGVRVTEPDALLDVLAEAGSGYHFFGKSAEKVVYRPLHSRKETL